MANQLDILFDLAQQAALKLATEIAKEAAKEANYDQNAAFILAKNLYFTKMQREPSIDEANNLYEVISELCDEQAKQQKKLKIQHYIDLIQNMWPTKR